jgi:hypothetical protein
MEQLALEMAKPPRTAPLSRHAVRSLPSAALVLALQMLLPFANLEAFVEQAPRRPALLRRPA